MTAAMFVFIRIIRDFSNCDYVPVFMAASIQIALNKEESSFFDRTMTDYDVMIIRVVLVFHCFEW
jgi:hypothetical protein